MQQMINLIQGDCLEEMEQIPGESIDLVLTDPPYGTTICRWDSIIPFEPMWMQLNRIIKPSGAIVLFGSEPFSSFLRTSNIEEYKYDWKWIKSKVGNFLNAKNAPLKKYEDIIVFSKGSTANCAKVMMKYNPQGLIAVEKPIKNTCRKDSSTITNRPSRSSNYIQKFTNYPTNILTYNSENKPIHPTQKPVELLEYLIRTYTNENETVLDFAMGSGSTGVACKSTNRDFIGIELDSNYFQLAKDRIERS